MSRAFITDKEDWIYCTKAGERCMHAEEGKACRETSCEFFDREVKFPDRKSSAVKVVRRQSKQTDAKSEKTVKDAKTMTASGTTGKTRPHHTTKKSSLKKPIKWGGRSGSNF